MKSIRAGKGLGDSLYLRAIVAHFLRSGQRLKVRSDWPDVFRGLDVEVAPFSRQVDITAHYASRKGAIGTTQFEDCCLSAGLKEPVRLGIDDWEVTNPALVARLRAAGRPIAVVQLPRAPMGRTDGFGAEVLPDCRVIQRLLNELKPTHTIVQVGAGTSLFDLQGVDIDLANRTSVAELIDVASAADCFLGYPSFLVPLAESFGRPAMFVWSRRGLNARQVYVRQITPQKVLHMPTSQYVIDEAQASPAFIDREQARAMFAGKHVALVGSGPGVMGNRSGFIDSHDLVVRVNNYKLFPETGKRVDVFYSFFGVSIKKTADELKRDGVKLCMCKCPDAQFIESAWHRRNGKMNGVDFRGIYQARANFWFCDTFVPSLVDFRAHFDLLGGHVPTTGFSAILDILSFEPKSLYLTGFDFFASGVHNVDEKWRRKNDADPIGHVPRAERAWLAANLDRHPIRLDDALAEQMKAAA